MPSQLIIKAHNPWKFWLKLLLFAAAFLLLAWVMYIYGYEQAGFDNRVLQEEQHRLQEQVFKLGKLNSELREKYTVLEKSNVIDRQAYNNVDTTLKDLQDELLELKAQVAFYQGIVSPKQTASGLHINSLKFATIDNKNSYRFKLVLSQLKNNQNLVRGRARLMIDGVLNGEHKQLKLSEVSGGKAPSLKMHFKYFQTLEGDVVLPEGFAPSSVLVDLNPRGRGTSRIKKNFDWTDIVS
jgi:hypothetical protein